MTLTRWTQTLHASWKPNLQYFKIRFDLLGEIRDTFGSGSFRVDGDDVGFRFRDGIYELTVQPNGVKIDVRVPEPDQDLLRSVLDLIMRSQDLTGTAAARCETQHLAPLDWSYDQARLETGSRLLSFVDRSVRPVDWSFLVDGEAPDRSSRYQSEFGVVQEDEIIKRLSRAVGRTRSEGREALAVWNELDLPDVAFFADSNVMIQKRMDAQSDEIWDGWQEAMHNVEVFLADVLSGITDGKS